MNKHILITLKIVLSTFLVIIAASITTYAWGDSDGGRPSYSLQEIDEKTEEFGSTPFFNSITITDSDYAWHKERFGEAIPTGTVTHEKNYVGAREDTGVNAGPENVWAGNDITVEDGKTYIIRMYVHNNNPNGWNAVAENTRVRFSIPYASSKTVKLNGFIASDNASPLEYVDYVNFNSDHTFHLEYIEGSALIENKGKASGSKLNDDEIVNSTTGALIGYDALDGRVPGGYNFDNYVTVEVKAVFDYEFSVEEKVRAVDSEDKEFKYAINANIGDTVEFQIQYKNISNAAQNNVTIRDILPTNMEYVKGSTVLYNTDYPKGASVDQDNLVDNGIIIGNYAAGANAYIRFRAVIVDNTMANGVNELVNWGQVQAGIEKQIIIQDNAKVYVVKIPEKTLTPLEMILVALIVLCLFLIALCIRKIYKLQHRR